MNTFEWNSQDHTEDENITWSWLRAVEWASYPIFLSQAIVPFLLFFFNWKIIFIFVVFMNWCWNFFKYKRIRLYSSTYYDHHDQLRKEYEKRNIVTDDVTIQNLNNLKFTYNGDRYRIQAEEQEDGTFKSAFYKLINIKTETGIDRTVRRRVISPSISLRASMENSAKIEYIAKLNKPKKNEKIHYEGWVKLNDHLLKLQIELSNIEAHHIKLLGSISIIVNITKWLSSVIFFIFFILQGAFLNSFLCITYPFIGGILAKINLRTDIKKIQDYFLAVGIYEK